MNLLVNNTQSGDNLDSFCQDVLKEIKSELKMVRERKDYLDVSYTIEHIYDSLKCYDLTLEDIGTTEEELCELVQIGYKSEAQQSLEIARNMLGTSHLHLYIRALRNVGSGLFEHLSWYWLKYFLSTLFCLRSRKTQKEYVGEVQEYLKKANLSYSDIETTETELQILESN